LKYAALLTSLLGLGSMPAYAQPYQVSCAGAPLTATLTSVLGEPRPADVGTPNRFHGGVDVTECNSLDSVQAIEGGTVNTTTACGGSTCIRVVGTNGRSFDYVHINPTVSIGTTVTAGQTLGAIINGGDHLHLNEIKKQGSLSLRVNPQRPNALAFSDGNQPAFVSTTIAGVTESIIPVPQFTATPFVYRNSTFFVRGMADIFINARDGSSRKGLYEVTAKPLGFFAFGGANIAFNNLRDDGGTDGEVRTLYYYRNSDSDIFIPSNYKINDTPNQQVQIGGWDTTREISNSIQLCGYLQDYPQGHRLSRCVSVMVGKDDSAVGEQVNAVRHMAGISGQNFGAASPEERFG
jgi:hypothetical protein